MWLTHPGGRRLKALSFPGVSLRSLSLYRPTARCVTDSSSAVGPSRHFAATHNLRVFWAKLTSTTLTEHDLGMLEFWDDRRRRRSKPL